MLETIHLIATASYCAILWVVQLLLYPQFRQVPAIAFQQYHHQHCRRMGWIVAPLFLIEGLTAIHLAWQLWESQPALQNASIALFTLGHGITFLLFVPLHRQLARGPVTKKDLLNIIRWNWLRTTIATARLGVVYTFVLEI